MKSAASCETSCDTQDLVNHRILERLTPGARGGGGWAGGQPPVLPPLLWPRAPLTQCREVQAVKGERPLAVPRARLACSIRRFGWGRRTWASKVLPWEGLRPQMHRGAGAHSVTVRPVLVEKRLHFPGAREKKKGTYKGDACLQVGGVQSRALGEQGGAGETGAVCRTACAKNRQSAACVLPAPSPPKSFPALLSLWTSSAGRRRHAHPFCNSRHLSLSLQGGCSPPKASDLRPAETTRRT